MDEAHIPAERSQTSQDTRLPQADVDQGRTGRDPVASGEGTSTTVGVTAGLDGTRPSLVRVGRIRSRRTFDALRHTPFRGRSGPCSVSYLQQSTWSRTEVAYAINRQVGNAVVRNRLRRQMRAIMSERAPSLPVGAYVVSPGPAGPMLGFNELKVAMSQALERATRRPAGHSPDQRHETGATR
jgi:ribonuclease P protein component